jgi:hypothetical protein
MDEDGVTSSSLVSKCGGDGLPLGHLKEQNRPHRRPRRLERIQPMPGTYDMSNRSEDVMLDLSRW